MTHTDVVNAPEHQAGGQSCTVGLSREGRAGGRVDFNHLSHGEAGIYAGERGSFIGHEYLELIGARIYADDRAGDAAGDAGIQVQTLQSWARAGRSRNAKIEIDDLAGLNAGEGVLSGASRRRIETGEGRVRIAGQGQRLPGGKIGDDNLVVAGRSDLTGAVGEVGNIVGGGVGSRVHRNRNGGRDAQSARGIGE